MRKIEILNNYNNLVNEIIFNYKNKNFKKVESLAKLLIEHHPSNEFGWKILAGIYHFSKRYNLALIAYSELIKIKPLESQFHFNLGLIQKFSFNYIDAIKSFQSAIYLQPNFLDAYLNLVKIHEYLDETENAINCYIKINNIKPKNTFVLNNLGVLYQKKGDVKKAKEYYKEALKFSNRIGGIYRNLANLKNYNKLDDDFYEMEKLYKKESSSSEKIQLCFGLGKILDDVREYERAYNYFKEGNKLYKINLNYKIEDDEILIEKIKSLNSNLLKIKLNDDLLKNNITPAFIVGMPRSGTTLIEQILSSHSKISGAGELTFLSNFGDKLYNNLINYNKKSLIDFRNFYLEKISKYSNGLTIVTDKMPKNFLYLGLISKIFPNSKIIHVIRDPRAVCWSLFRTLFGNKSNKFSYDLQSLIKFHQLYKDLMLFWKERLNNQIYDLNYDKLTSKPELEIRKLIKFLNLDWEENCLNPQLNQRIVSTASNLQIRHKIYKNSSNKWKNYKQYIETDLKNLKNNFSQISF